MQKYRKLFLIVIAVAAGVVFWYYRSNSISSSDSIVNSSGTNASTTQGFNKSRYPTDRPESIWVVVNKKHPLEPANYMPADLVVPSTPLRVPGNESMQLRSEAAKALERMFAAANADGVQLMLSSGYRSYSYQTSLYNGYVKSNGAAAADNFSARPGHSEHQTGLAADIEPTSRHCELQACFAQTPEGQWLAKDAYKYGFILRYSDDQTSVTGYEPEPWHFRYVGVELAGQMHKVGTKTLEEFFGISGGPSY